jgi:acetyl-CoA C-acetyltransferase
MAERCAIVGIGQTHHKKRREESIAGLCREAAVRALADAGRCFADVDAVVVGKTPDIFDGLMNPEHYLADALGAVGKPMMRISTAGSVGGHTAIQAAHLITSGLFKTVLAVAYAKESEGDINWAVQGGGMPFQSELVAGPGGYFSLHIRDYIRRSGAAADVGIRVAYKDRLNALKNPYAHVRMADITYQQVADSPMLWEPIRYLETCPSSDGACAMVLCDERSATHSPSAPPAWILGMAARTEPGTAPFRDQVNPLAGSECARAMYAQAGITQPRKQIQLAELYAPFSWMEPMWLENMGIAELNGGGARMVERGETELRGAFPVDPSGGVLSANPTGATGMIRFAEAALQVRGQAGEHQVDGARVALGHAQGGAASYLATWLVGSQKP